MSGLIVNPYLVASAASGFVCDAADFDGSNDYMTIANPGLSGIADGKQALVSLWVYPDVLGSRLFAIGASAATQRFGLSSSAGTGFIAITGRNAAGTVILLAQASDNGLSTGTGYHILFSCDMADPAKRFLYINGNAVTVVWTTYTNDSFELTQASAIGGLADGGGKLNGQLAEVYFHPTYLDISIGANRLLFRTAAGKAADLGADGSTPLGLQPMCYQHLDAAEAADNFALNAGSGGNFTVTGALTTGAWSPTD